MSILGLISNFILVGACLFTLYSLKLSDNQYGYSVAAFGLVHGLMGIISSVSNEEDECSRTGLISNAVMEVLPLPMANVEIYGKSSLSSVALAHTLSLIPLLYDLLGTLGGDYSNTTDTLKDVSLLFNIASTAYLAANEQDPLYVAVAFAALITRFGASLVEYFVKGIGRHVGTLGNATIIGVMTYILTNK